jgi:two-component system, OmpR family, response regulator
MESILIVDDDPAQANMLQDFLKNSERNIRTINSGEDLLRTLDTDPDVIFLDYNFDMAGATAMDGLQILQEIKKRKPKVEVVMLSAQDKIDVALNTMKYGAFDYVIKGETAFHRAENALANILKRNELQNQLRFYKRFAVSFTWAVIATLVIIFAVYGMYSAGWFK